MAYSRGGFQPPSVGMTDEKFISATGAALSPYFSPAQVQTIQQWYEPARQELGNWHAAAKLFGEYYLYCGAYEAAKHFAHHSRKPVHAFIFDHISVNDPEQYLGAANGNELDFNFNSTVYNPPYEFDATDLTLSKRMVSAWASIAYRGAPVSNEVAGWTAYNPADPKAYVLEQPSTDAFTAYSSAMCANWSPLFHANNNA